MHYSIKNISRIRVGRLATLLLLTSAILLPYSSKAVSRLSDFSEEPTQPVGLKWETDPDGAIGRAQLHMKPILLLFTSPRCMGSYRMKSGPLQNEEIQSLLRKFERVEIDVSKRIEQAMMHQIRSTPAIRIMGPDGRIKESTEGYLSSSELRKILSAVLNKKPIPTITPIFDKLKSGKSSQADWQTAMLAMSELEGRDKLRSIAKNISTNDRVNIVSCLTNSQLSVRTGTLDFLEEIAGNSMGFDAWKTFDMPEQKDALIKWQAWSTSTNFGTTLFSALTEDEFKRYLQDLISDDRARSRYALRVLSHGGKTVLHGFEDFLKSNPTLSSSKKRRIKEVQYTLTIAACDGKNPSASAHRIIWGNQDVQLQAIHQIADCGPSIMPIFIDLLSSPESLIRETVVEAAFTASGRLAVKAMSDHLKHESDSDVIYAILTNLSKIKTRRSLDTLFSYFTHENEDLAIAAIEGSINSKDSKLLPLLKDKRWRVRVAALQGLKISSAEISKALYEALDDPDAFVRHTAVTTIKKLNLGDSAKPLQAAYKKHEDMRGIIISALLSMNKEPPANYEKDLFSGDHSDLLFVLDNLKTTSVHGKNLIYKSAKFDNPDVSCTALRRLASLNQKRASDIRLLTKILRNGSPEQKLTIIQEFNVRYDSTKKLQTSLLAKTSRSVVSVQPTTDSNSSPKVENLIREFLSDTDKPDPVKQSTEDSKQQAERPIRTTEEAMLDEIAIIMNNPKESDLLRNSAMFLLCGYNHCGALRIAEEQWDTLTSSERSKVASTLGNFGKHGLPLFKKALSDRNAEVWQSATMRMHTQTTPPAFYKILFDELTGATNHLSASMIWNMGLNSATTKNLLSTDKEIKTIIASADKHKPETLVLILSIIAKSSMKEIPEDTLLTLTEHENEFVRRAAWFAIKQTAQKIFTESIDTIITDESLYVRDVIPALFYLDNYYQKLDIYFTEDEHFSGYRGMQITRQNSFRNSRYRTKKLSDEITQVLHKLSQDDPSPWVRYRSYMALLSNLITVDLNDVLDAGMLCKRRKAVASIMNTFLDRNKKVLGKSFQTVLPLLHNPDDNARGTRLQTTLEKQWGINTYVEPSSSNQFTFAASKKVAKPVMAEFNPHNSRGEVIFQEKTKLTVIYFITPNCKECRAVGKDLARFDDTVYDLDIKTYDIRSPEGVKYNEALSSKMGVLSKRHALTPAVFTRAGYLIKNDFVHHALGELLAEAAAELPDPDWAEVTNEELDTATKSIEDRAKSYTIPLITWAGLIDGINPCAFATIIFLLSYLRIRRRTGREIIEIGIAYVFAVFITYFVLGLGLISLISKLVMLERISSLINILMAIAMFIVSMLSFNDARKVLAGKAKEMTLQLSDSTKQRIHSAIRQGASSKRYVLAAFILGVAVSVLEFACTGQIYLPTITYMIQSGFSRTRGVSMLILYNIAFILPLIVVFSISAAGTENKKLQDFMMRHMAFSKFLLGIFFAIFFILFVRFTIL